MNKITLLLLTLLIFPGAPTFAGGTLSRWLGNSQEVDLRQNLGTLAVLPDEMLYHILDQGIPEQINTVEEFKCACRPIARFAATSQYGKAIVTSDLTTQTVASKISKEKADEFWKHYISSFNFMFEHGNELIQALIPLVRAGADINMANHEGSPALIVKWRYKDNFPNWLLQCGANANRRDKFNGYTTLMYASLNGNKNMVALLLAHGVKVNKKAKTGGCTALIMAASYGHKEIVKLLLEHGANVNLQDNSGKTPLDYAETQEIKELLLAAQKRQAEQNNNNNNA